MAHRFFLIGIVFLFLHFTVKSSPLQLKQQGFITQLDTISHKDALHQWALMIVDSFSREIIPPWVEQSANTRKFIRDIPADFYTTQQKKSLFFNNNTDFKTFLAEQKSAYQLRLNAISTDNIPDIFQYDLREEIYWRISIANSLSSLTDSTKIIFFKNLDDQQKTILSPPIEQLKKNPRYGLVDNFHQGFARIRKNQVYGYLNLLGTETITCQYEQAEPFNQGRALVKRQFWHFVSQDGKESFMLPKVVDAKALKWGFSLVKLNTNESKSGWAIIDNLFDSTQTLISDVFDEISPLSGYDDLFIVKKNNAYGIIHITGKMRYDTQIDQFESLENYKLIKFTVNQKVGFMNDQGLVKLSPIYDDISSFNKYNIAHLKEGENYRVIKYPSFDLSNAYQAITAFGASGRAIVKMNDLYGAIDLSFKEVIPIKYKSLENFGSMGLARACLEPKRCGIIDTLGNTILPIQYVSVGKPSRFGIVEAQKRLCTGKEETCLFSSIYDLKGNLVLNQDEKSNYPFKYRISDTLVHNKYIVVNCTRLEANKGYYSTTYHLVTNDSLKNITKTDFEEIQGFDKNFIFWVKKNSRWGLMDTTGKMILECTAKEILFSSEGIYAVKSENNKIGFVTKKGKMVTGFEFEEVNSFRNGLAVVSEGKNKVGIINRFNAKIAPTRFKSIEHTSNGIKLVSPQNETIELNHQGECITSCELFNEILKGYNK